MYYSYDNEIEWYQLNYTNRCVLCKHSAHDITKSHFKFDKLKNTVISISTTSINRTKYLASSHTMMIYITLLIKWGRAGVEFNLYHIMIYYLSTMGPRKTWFKSICPKNHCAMWLCNYISITLFESILMFEAWIFWDRTIWGPTVNYGIHYSFQYTYCYLLNWAGAMQLQMLHYCKKYAFFCILFF